MVTPKKAKILWEVVLNWGHYRTITLYTYTEKISNMVRRA